MSSGSSVDALIVCIFTDQHVCLCMNACRQCVGASIFLFYGADARLEGVENLILSIKGGLSHQSCDRLTASQYISFRIPINKSLRDRGTLFEFELINDHSSVTGR